MMRRHFMPPPVEPAEPPMNMHKKMMAWDMAGHMFIVGRGVPGGGDDGDHLEGGVAQACPAAVVYRRQILNPNHEGQEEAHGQVKPAFRILPESQRSAPQNW
jgi:hypothetical protein